MTKDSILGWNSGTFKIKKNARFRLSSAQSYQTLVIIETNVTEGGKRYKGKVEPEQAMKALRGSRVTALLFL